MGTSEIIRLAEEYLILGMIVAIFAAIGLGIGYYIIYKKNGNVKKIKLSKVIFVAIFLCYIVVVIGATMLSRGGGWNNSISLQLFYSYKEAWNSFSEVEWRNIILNILLFVPFGFLLPIISVRFRKFWKTYLIGFCFTVIIELSQLVLKRGVVELDDIFNNLLGAMIGYGVYAVVQMIALLIKKKKADILLTSVFQIPLIFTIILFTTIFILYDKQELGNLTSNYIVPYSTSKLEVSTIEEYSKENQEVSVYYIGVVSINETQELAKDFFQKTGSAIDESRINIYEDTAVYWSTNQNSFWIDYVGKTYVYTDFSERLKKMNTSAEKNEIKIALEKFNIEIPENVEFDNMGNGKYRFLVEQYINGETMYDGILTCTYMEDGSFEDINNSIITSTMYKDFPIITEQQAYEMICEGKFNYKSNDQLYIKTGKVTLQYVADSKGFYQPVYCFTANINGEDTEICIPAIKN